MFSAPLMVGGTTSSYLLLNVAMVARCTIPAHAPFTASSKALSATMSGTMMVEKASGLYWGSRSLCIQSALEGERTVPRTL